MTRVLLIHAGPTPWDAENRVTGAHSLPLTAEAAANIRTLVNAMTDSVTAIYACRANEACQAVAKILGEKFQLRPRDRPELDEMRLGLWEGLTRGELEHRFPSVFPAWEQQPLSVVPPDGESLPQAAERIGPALHKLLKRNRAGTVALALRPLALQIVAGLLREQTPEAIADHLHAAAAMATIDISEP
jgi:broad specificity phosphatase PhoE